MNCRGFIVNSRSTISNNFCVIIYIIVQLKHLAKQFTKVINPWQNGVNGHRAYKRVEADLVGRDSSNPRLCSSGSKANRTEFVQYTGFLNLLTYRRTCKGPNIDFSSCTSLRKHMWGLSVVCNLYKLLDYFIVRISKFNIILFSVHSFAILN